MSELILQMTPETGTGLVRFVGDAFRVELKSQGNATSADGLRARLRTTVGRGDERRREIRAAHFENVPPAGRAWRDLEMTWNGNAWCIDLALDEVGYFQAKAYVIDERGWLHWPAGDDLGINVQPDWCRTANTIYCAFPRMFGSSKTSSTTVDAKREAELKVLDEQGYTVIPPSGTLRDLQSELPHVFEELGCRILHLLPVSPTPTTLAKFGRFGSPYALQDLTAIDPALIDFDHRTTGVQQFEELTDAVHLHDGRVILDLVINHTGWHSTLFEQHPEWFVRDEKGIFVSPGAWGNTWEDLVEIDPRSTELWDELAEAFLVWCRRGVDGFRCDAGYKVPVLVWQYITARVHDEFPETVFLLEGLGGGWDDTAVRLTEGGMQWAYSELFQNYSAPELCGYLDHSWEQSDRVGLLVHYSETHDNDRLAKKGRVWSLLRNRLCALASVSGGFGFTNGVEWLAAEQVNVHSARGLNWGAEDNIVAELAELNRLLREHPCFFDGAELERLSKPDDGVFAFERRSVDGSHRVLVLANLNLKEALSYKPSAEFEKIVSGPIEKCLLVGEADACRWNETKGTLDLEPAVVICMQIAGGEVANGEDGDAYRKSRARASFAHRIARSVYLPLPTLDWRELAALAEEPEQFIVRLLGATGPESYVPVVSWSELDQSRIVPVPPEHWLLIRLPHRFRCQVSFADGTTLKLEATPGRSDWFAMVPPGQVAGDAELRIKTFGKAVGRLCGVVRLLTAGGEWTGAAVGDALHQWAANRNVLLTNGRGGMTRINLDLGRVQSKYDCVLGANLHDTLPVDRHVFVKRLRLWANADGFVVPLNGANLIGFLLDDSLSRSVAVWRFGIQAGNGRSIVVALTAWMVPGENTVAFEIRREQTLATDVVPLRLTARFDVEDRNFHCETRRNEGAEAHFAGHTRLLNDARGFEFGPAPDRRLRVLSGGGVFHQEPEWSEHIPHPIEVTRGQTGQGDGWSPGWFDLPLDQDKQETLLVVTAEPSGGPSDSMKALLKRVVSGRPRTDLRAADAVVSRPAVDEAVSSVPRADAFEHRLRLAAEQFVVRRGDFKSVIAGYPWFLDWGRDTLICARGLIAGGWIEEVKQLLIVFGRFEEQGTLPNTIHGADASNRDTSDAPLWYGVVAEELASVAGDEVYTMKVDDTRTVADVLRSIATGYLSGTTNGIRVDPDSGLVWSPSHFTWMDTNYPAGTPREGYPIEIQALWIRLLQLLEQMGAESTGEPWSAIAERATNSLEELYWQEDRGWYGDSIIASPGTPAVQGTMDRVLRSNCMIPVSFGLLNGARARRCVEAAKRYLVVPGGLRSLAPLPADPPLAVRRDGHLLNDPARPYWGRYEGDEDTRRKPAYHNGTAWTWTFPTFCEALTVVYGGSRESVAAATAYLGSMDALLEEGCFGQIPEVMDGDAPHAQRGCDAQAWGVTEALRVVRKLGKQADSTVDR